MRFNQYLTKLFCCILSTLLVLSICFIGCSLTGCGNDDDDDTASAGGASAFDASTTLNDFANTVVLATYTDLDNKAGELLSAVQALGAATNQAHLELAQGAWKATRKPWEQSEAFLFGPVDTQGLDPALDSWPVNRVDLDGVLASESGIDFSIH